MLWKEEDTAIVGTALVEHSPKEHKHHLKQTLESKPTTNTLDKKNKTKTLDSQYNPATNSKFVNTPTPNKVQHHNNSIAGPHKTITLPPQ